MRSEFKQAMHSDDDVDMRLKRGVAYERLDSPALALKDFARVAQQGDVRGTLYTANVHLRRGELAAVDAALQAHAHQLESHPFIGGLDDGLDPAIHGGFCDHVSQVWPPKQKNGPAGPFVSAGGASGVEAEAPLLSVGIRFQSQYCKACLSLGPGLLRSVQYPAPFLRRRQTR